MTIVPFLMLRRYLRFRKQMKSVQNNVNNSEEKEESPVNNDTKVEQL